MHILITGATGFIGKHLTQKLLEGGHEVTVVSRNKEKVHALFGDKTHSLARKELTKTILSGVACVIHLAGTPINTFPWNKKNKDKIYNSRIATTKLLVDILPPSCHSFLCGSAIGYYPSSLDMSYDTSFINTTPSSFMEQLCVDREQEAKKAISTTTRVVTLRTGLVLGPEKVGKLLRLSTRWMGGIILGSGQQRMPLITLDAWVDRCITIIEKRSITGPINMVTENTKHEDYIRSLATELHRPVRLRLPAKLLQFILGETSQLILGSWHIVPSNI